MRYDDNGFPIGLDDIEYFPNFLRNYNANDFFQSLLDSIPWQDITWRDRRQIRKLVFRYGEFERNIRKYDVLERLIALIESVFETRVSCVWCDFYRQGCDFSPYHENIHDSHFFILSFGNDRLLTTRPKIKSRRERKNYKLGHGEGLHFAPQISNSNEYSVPRKPGTDNQHIDIIFYMEPPYSKRVKHQRIINVLGRGRIPVWFNGPYSQFPDDAVAVISPASLNVLFEGGVSYSNSPIEAFFPVIPNMLTITHEEEEY